MKFIIPTPEQSEITSLVWACDCQYRKEVGENPKRAFLSKEALVPFNLLGELKITARGETDIEINGLSIFYDATLIGKSCYCRK